MNAAEPHPITEENSRAVILVVEDEVLVRMATAEQLRQAGYAVVEAANAHEALEVLRHTADVKLILTDIRMPGSIDGVELARLARSEFPAIKVVLASGHLSSVEQIEHEGYFRKPYDMLEVIRHIKRLLG